MNLFLNIVLLVGVCYVAAMALYQFALAVAAFMYPRSSGSPDSDPKKTFTILIPAHDEADNISRTVATALAMDYPTERFEVCVIADNCTDDTATIAVETGACCLERHHATLRGKGHALAWAIPQVLERGRDAIVILDADCDISKNFLHAASEHLERGTRVLQSRYLVSNPDANFRTYAMAVARILENDWFYRGKAMLGLPGVLLGTGMVFERDVFGEVPWNESGLCEDADYSDRLCAHGIWPRFAPELAIQSPFPTDMNQLTVQRSRWITGNRAEGSGLVDLVLGLLRFDPRRVDAGLTRLVLSRPKIILQLLIVGLLLAVCLIIYPEPWTVWVGLVYATTIVGYAAYALLGVFSVGVNPHRLKLLALAPVFVLRYVLMAIRVMISRRPGSWERTPRSPQTNSKPL